MKKYLALFSLLCICVPLTAEELRQCPAHLTGRKVEQINITSARIDPYLISKKLSVKEGDIFSCPSFDKSKEAMHDMKIFKEVKTAFVENPDGTITINIDATDAHYLFPIAFAAGGGGKTTVAGGILEANKFKRGESASLFIMGNSDGVMGTAGLNYEDNSFFLMYGDFEYDELHFTDGAYNVSGLFSNGDDNERGLLNKYTVRRTNGAFGYSRTFDDRLNLGAGFVYSDVDYKQINGYALPSDDGLHNRITLNAKYYKNIKPSKGMASAFGSIFGMGTSDVEEKIADLPAVKLGYMLSLLYANGAGYTGADFTISTLHANATANLEFKNRNILWAFLSGAQNFEGAFFDQIQTKDVLTKGKYTREYRGEKAWGAGLYTQIFLLKNTTAILVFEPFVESAFMFDTNTRYNQTGAGASLYVMFWRFQFPLGVTFTSDTSRGDNTVSFMFGGGF